MAALKCLACGVESKPGDEACSACSSSLNLKLCSACEAVNASGAERCHQCGAAFEAAAVEAPVIELEEAPAEKSLPAMRQYVDVPQERRGRARGAALWVLAFVLAAGAVYAYYELPIVPVAKGFIASSTAPKPAPAPVAAEPPPAPAVAVVPPSPPAPKAVQSPPKAAKAPVAPAASAPAKQPVSTVTHTRGAAAPALASSGETQASVPAALPQRPRVTHTKAPGPGEAPALAATAAVAAPQRTEPVKDSSACPPGVAALGLCNSK